MSARSASLSEAYPDVSPSSKSLAKRGALSFLRARSMACAAAGGRFFGAAACGELLSCVRALLSLVRALRSAGGGLTVVVSPSAGKCSRMSASRAACMS